MNSKQYVEASLNTESRPERLNFGTVCTDALLGVMVCSGELVDVAKKVMFYGKQPDLERLIQNAATLRDLGEKFLDIAQNYPADLTNVRDFENYDELAKHLIGLDLANINPRLMHASMGLFTEAGETATAIVDAWRAGTQPDRVNFCEELGDGFWYAAIASDELGVSFETLFEQNVTKLQDKRAGRYKQGSFDVDAANIRNLEAERELLTAGVVSADVEVGEVEHMVATTDANVFYSPSGQDFVWFDEAAQERGREDSFSAAVNAQRQYAYDLSRPVAQPAPAVSPAHATPRRSPVVPPAVQSSESLGEKARGIAAATLDRIAQGAEAAKQALKK